MEPRLPVTRRLSEETNNKWHPESGPIQTGRAGESEAPRGGGQEAAMTLTFRLEGEEEDESQQVDAESDKRAGQKRKWND